MGHFALKLANCSMNWAYNPSKHNLLLYSGVHYTSQQISLESYQYDLTWIPISTCCDAYVRTTDTTRKPGSKSVPHESPTRHDPRKSNKLSCSHFMTYLHAPMPFMVPLLFTQKFLVLSLFSNIWIATSFVSRNWKANTMQIANQYIFCKSSSLLGLYTYELKHVT